MRLPMDMVDGHVVARFEGRRILLDTGSPQSYSAAGKERLSIDGTVISFGTISPDVSELLREIPCRIDLLLGMDACRRFTVLIRTSTGELVLEDPARPIDNSVPADQQGSVSFTTNHNVPIIQVRTDADRPVIFDTGAPISYLDGPHIRDLGTRQDFYLGIGRFRTRIGQVLVKVGGRKVNLIAGEAPPKLRRDLQTAGVEGILGSELLTLADVALDWVGRRLLIQWH